MPYRYLPLVIGLIAILTPIAFWPGYFGKFGSSPWQFHLHGITATLWILAVGFQSWSIHARRRDLHRAGGLATLTMFPLFLAGAGGVTWTMATATLEGDAFYQLWGARLGLIDFTSALALLWLVHLALAERRNTQLHAHAMVATLLFITMPLFSRLNQYLPGLQINGPADFPIFGFGVQLSQAMAIAVALWLAHRAGRNRRPMLVAAAVLAAQSLLFETFARTALWKSIHLSFASVPLWLMLALHALLGAAVLWHGWQAGALPRRAGKTA